MRGAIKSLKLDNGYGFIRLPEGGKDVFFHIRDLESGLAFDDSLQERLVEFEIVHSERGQRAANVRAVQ